MAKTITLTLPHSLAPDEVKRRVVSAISDARTKHPDLLSGAQERWTDNQMDFTARAMGQNISGTIAIEPSVVRVSIDLPFMLAMLAGNITPRIQAEGRKLLDSK